MPPEIDDSKSKTEPLPLIDFYSFHQGAFSMSDKNTNGNAASKDSIELTDPYGYHQGLNSLARALGNLGDDAKRSSDEQKGQPKDSKAESPGSAKPDNVECINGVCRILSPAELAAKKAREGSRGEAKEKGILGDLQIAEIKIKPPSNESSAEPKEKAPAQNEIKVPGDLSHLLPNPFTFHQGDKTLPRPAEPGPVISRPGEPAPFVPPKDVTPLPVPPTPSPELPPEVKPLPADRIPTIEIDPQFPPGSGKSPIVEAYERKQGARHAGSGTLPPIDAIPLPSDLTPPVPVPGPQPGPKPDIAPWAPPKVDDKPEIKPVDFRPNPSDLISKLEPKYETSDVATAVKMAKETGLPLAVHVGASWCGYCVQMEQNTWPAVEGTGNQKGSLQGKVVVLHMDVDHARNLQGEDARLANEILKNRGSSVPILRVFKVDQSGNFTKTAENRGAINSKSGLENFLIKGGVQR